MEPYAQSEEVKRADEKRGIFKNTLGKINLVVAAAEAMLL